MSDEKRYYIYGHWTKDTNECFYIGSSGSRARMYLTNVGQRNSIWDEINSKHGHEAFVIFDGLTKAEALEEEKRLQIINKPRACLIYGSGVGCKRSDEAKARMSEAIKGNKSCLGRVIGDKARRKISEANKGNTYRLGKAHTEESKVKMSESTKGNKHPRARAVINCRGEIFDTAKEATLAIGLKGATNVAKACRLEQESAGKYEDGTKIKWKYYKEESYD